MELKIISFSWETFSSEIVISTTIMSMIWEITVLNNHAPLITAFKPSTMFILYKDENWVSQRNDFAIWSWVLEVNNSKVKIVTDMLIDIEDQDELDKWAVELARNEALALMDKYKQSKDRVDMEKFIEAEDMLLKSIAQLKLYEVKK